MESDEQQEWSNADILRIIDAYKACPELWNQSDPNYNNKPVRIEAWDRIAVKFGITKVECKKKVIGLISTYRRHKTTGEDGEANGETEESSGFAYKALQFLDETDAKQTTPPPVNHVTSERQAMINVLTLYKENSCLWDSNHPQYLDKQARHEALSKLLVEWEKMYPGSDLHMVKRKLENWKTSYRRQRKQLELSKKDGQKKVFTPTLWYYNYLTFLDDMVNEAESANTDVESKEKLQIEYEDPLAIFESDLSNQEIDEEAVNEDQLSDKQKPSTITKRKRKRKDEDDDTALITSALRILESTAKQLRNEHDLNEIKTFCKFVSSKMSSYSRLTRQGVQHAFYDILMKADRGHFEKLSAAKSKLSNSPNEKVPEQ